jgi:transcriptional regulator with XRE-family HTH domain
MIMLNEARGSRRESDEMSMQRLGAFIREQRRVLHLKQGDLAIQLNMDQAMLSKIENGTQTGSIDTLIAIARALKIDPGTLVNILADEQPVKFDPFRTIMLPGTLDQEDKEAVLEYISALEARKIVQSMSTAEKKAATQAAIDKSAASQANKPPTPPKK